MRQFNVSVVLILPLVLGLLAYEYGDGYLRTDASPDNDDNSYEKGYNTNENKNSAYQNGYISHGNSGGPPRNNYNSYGNNNDPPRNSDNPYGNSSGPPRNSDNPYGNSSGPPRNSYNPYENSSGPPRNSYNPYENSSGPPRNSYNLYGNSSGSNQNSGDNSYESFGDWKPDTSSNPWAAPKHDPRRGPPSYVTDPRFVTPEILKKQNKINKNDLKRHEQNMGSQPRVESGYTYGVPGLLPLPVSPYGGLPGYSLYPGMNYGTGDGLGQGGAYGVLPGFGGNPLISPYQGGWYTVPGEEYKSRQKDEEQ